MSDAPAVLLAAARCLAIRDEDGRDIPAGQGWTRPLGGMLGARYKI